MNRFRVDVIDWDYAAILARKTPAERVAMVVEAHRVARGLAECGVRWLHPDWSNEQVQVEVARRMLYGAGPTFAPDLRDPGAA